MPPWYKPRIPWFRRMSFAMWKLDEGFELEVEGEEGLMASWARHFISSVGVLMTHVASPPTAPASQVVQRLVPVVLPLGVERLWRDDEEEEESRAWFRASSVRLYATKSRAFRAP